MESGNMNLEFRRREKLKLPANAAQAKMTIDATNIKFQVVSLLPFLLLISIVHRLN